MFTIDYEMIMTSTNRKQLSTMKITRPILMSYILVSSLLWPPNVCESSQLDWLWKNNRGIGGAGGILQSAHSPPHDHFTDISTSQTQISESAGASSESQLPQDYSYFEHQHHPKQQHSFVPTPKVQLSVPQIDSHQQQQQQAAALHHAHQQQQLHHHSNQFADIGEQHDHEQMASSHSHASALDDFGDYDSKMMPQVLPFLKTFSFSKEIALPSLAQLSMLPLKLPVTIFKKTTPKLFKMFNAHAAKLVKGPDRRPESMMQQLPQLSPADLAEMENVEMEKQPAMHHHQHPHMPVHHMQPQVMPVYKESGDAFSQVLSLPQYHIMNMTDHNEPQHDHLGNHGNANSQPSQITSPSYQEYRYKSNNEHPTQAMQHQQHHLHADNSNDNTFYDHEHFNNNNYPSSPHSNSHPSPSPGQFRNDQPPPNWKTHSSVFNRNPWRPMKMIKFEIKDRIYTNNDYQNYGRSIVNNHKPVTNTIPPNVHKWNTNANYSEETKDFETTQTHSYTEPPSFGARNSKSKKSRTSEASSKSSQLESPIDSHSDYSHHSQIDPIEVTTTLYMDSTDAPSVDDYDEQSTGKPYNKRLTDRLKWFLDSVKDKQQKLISSKPTRFHQRSGSVAVVVK